MNWCKFCNIHTDDDECPSCGEWIAGEMKAYQYAWNDGAITEIEARNELTARIKVLACRKDFGGIPYAGMMQAQRRHIGRMRELVIVGKGEH